MPAENALSLDWQDQPYDKLVAEARRVGAFDGFGAHYTGTWHSATCPTSESRVQCACAHEADGVWIWIQDNTRTAVRVWFPTPGLDVRASKITSVCPFHPRLPDPTAHMEVLIQECALVGRFQKLLAVPMSWVFTPDRKLTIDLRKLATVSDGDAIRALALTAEFAGKVVIRG